MGRMQLPVLDKFCFNFDLRTGCIVMGVVNTLLTFIATIILTAFAIDLKELSDTIQKRDESDAQNMSSVVYTIVVLQVILLVIKTLFDMIFVYAAYKEKCGLMKKYCIFWMVFLVLSIIGFLKTLFHMSAGQVISNIIFFAQNFYYIIVIRSYLISLNEDGVL